jgi:hypothetical protein
MKILHRENLKTIKVFVLSIYSLQYMDLLYRKFETYIPRKETARPRFQFLHSFICERFIYSHDLSSADQPWEYINRSQMHECGKLRDKTL